MLSCLSAACASGQTGTTNSSSTATASASASSSPTVTAAAGYRVLYTTSTTNGNDIYLYSSAGGAPQKLVSLAAGAPPEPQFTSAQRIAYLEPSGQSGMRITRFDLSTQATATEVTTSGYVAAFAYSHDGTMLAYLVHDQQPSGAALHVRRNGQEFVLTLNNIPGRGVGRDDELLLEYAPDDRYLLMVDTFVGNQAQAPETGQFLVLRTADNTVAFVPPSGVSANATMATWARSADRLFYRDAVGVRSWDAGIPSVGTLAGGLRWYDPAPSGDGRWLAFTDIDAQFVPRVRLYDGQSSQQVATVSAPRSHPIFVSADTIWSLEEQPCSSECLGGPYQTSGKVFAYNLTTKTESTLPFSDVHELSQLAVLSG